jgi:hypothetical protein
MTWASVLRGESETEEEFLDCLSEEWMAVEGRKSLEGLESGARQSL